MFTHRCTHGWTCVLAAVILGGCVDSSARLDSSETEEERSRAAVSDVELGRVARSCSRARRAGATLAVLEIVNVEELPTGFVSGSGPEAIRFRAGVDVEAIVLDSEGALDSVLHLRLPSDCSGTSVEDPLERVCAELAFPTPEFRVGERWLLGVREHGTPNEGLWGGMCGTRLAASDIPGVVLGETLQSLSLGERR